MAAHDAGQNKRDGEQHLDAAQRRQMRAPGGQRRRGALETEAPIGDAADQQADADDGGDEGEAGAHQRLPSGRPKASKARTIAA